MKNYLRSFAGGEVTPELFGRVDDIKFQTGLALCKNFITLPHGPARNRPGSQFGAVSATAGSATFAPRLIPFSFSAQQTVMIEFGQAYARLFINNVPVLHPAIAGISAWTTPFHYTPGMFVKDLGVAYQCVVEHDSNAGNKPPNELFWHQQPASGVYEIGGSHAFTPVPYSNAQLDEVRFFQSNDVITLLHRIHPPRELRRYGATDWRGALITGNPNLSTPLGPQAGGTEQQAVIGSTGMKVAIVAVASAGGKLRLTVEGRVPWIEGESIYGQVVFTLGNTVGPRFFRATNFATPGVFDLLETDGTGVAFPGVGAFTAAGSFFQAFPMSSELVQNYRVTAVDAAGSESQPPIPAQANVGNTIFAEGAFNTINWTAVTGAVRYRVYKKLSGTYGLIGTVDHPTVTFKDDNIGPSLGEGHPILDTTLTVSPYPEAGCYHEQRRVFGIDQLIRASRSGTERDMSYHIPFLDDDRLSFGIAATEFSQIQHLISMGVLVALTGTTEYSISSPDSAVLTPTSIETRPQSFVGSSHVKPWLVNNVLLYCAARGGHLRQFVYRAVAQGYLSDDLSMRAAHLFDNFTIRDLAVSKAPYQVVWAVSSTGKLLGLTYVPEQEVMGWHQHTLGDANTIVERVAVITEGVEDSVYLVVKRVTSSGTQRYIERLAPINFGIVETCVFMDASTTQTGTFGPGTQIAGYGHLIGKTVAILADGIVLPQQVVNGVGEIKNPLSVNITRITVGLPIEAELQTLPIAMQIDGLAQAQPKAISNVYVRVANSAPFRLGPALSDLAPSDAAAPSIRGLLTKETLRTDRFPVLSPPAWSEDGQIYVKHTTPLPLTVVGVTLEVALGGN